MNVNRINRWIASVPVLKLQLLDGVITVQDTCHYLPDLKVVDPHTAKTAQVVLIDLAASMCLTEDPILFAKLFIEFLRNAVFRRYVMATALLTTSKPPRLQDACERLHWTDDQVYSLAAASIAVLANARPDHIMAPVNLAGVSHEQKILGLSEGHRIEFDIKAKLAMMADAADPVIDKLEQTEDQGGAEAEVEPTEPEPMPEPVEQPEPGVMNVQELDNHQQLVKVRSRNGNVHYIVVDADVDVARAPQVWDLINRDALKLSVNVTTDRLARSKVINDYLAEGWSPAEVAELMEVPKHIVTGDIHLLRKLDRLGDTPGMRHYKRNQ